ncbi:DNA methyltransferase [Pseudodesulfovibrio sp. JC047]|uniref:MGMT family protein n=1 Tax=Pseudodesulfovibrio sp. JC047 TaxID=2683199 RepID=UPI0013D08CCC|nr:MGMT family protein [Pseudodesulfovibrio sp. JC047]NDV20141.1 DNA methyltransferase [Pseudodesulfovibrio sp. JC047]
MPVVPFTQKVIDLIHAIPAGKVSTYGHIAAMAGNRRAARQVARILHSFSRKEALPWHRVINKQGQISLPRSHGYEMQKKRLEAEGVIFDTSDTIDLNVFLWRSETP